MEEIRPFRNVTFEKTQMDFYTAENNFKTGALVFVCERRSSFGAPREKLNTETEGKILL
jgi:hypothetical protein